MAIEKVETTVTDGNIDVFIDKKLKAKIKKLGTWLWTSIQLTETNWGVNIKVYGRKLGGDR